MVLNPGDFIQGKTTGDDYEINSLICEGGFGKVFLITRLSDNSQYIAKEPKDLDKKLIKAIHSEFTVLDNLEKKNIPYVARAIEMTEYQNQMGNMVPVLILEKAGGEGLDKLMQNGPISEKDCLEIITKVAESLTGIHEAGYIHRDISPDNIFVEDLGGRNEVTLIDFGIAALKAEHDTHVMVSVIAGKVFFSPPEQLDSGRGAQVSIGNDIFSTGATAIALLCGEPSFTQYRGKAPSAPYDVHNEVPALDQHFRDVIYKSTWADRGGRFATMKDMAKALGGGIPDESLPRIVSDGRAYTLTGDGPWIIGRKNDLDQPANIPVAETSITKSYISRKHVDISKNSEGIFKLTNVGLNDVMIKHNNRWMKTPKQGFPLGAKHVEIALGYTTTPPDETDADGNKLLPGPYKVIEFFPPKGDGTKLLSF
ncbi:MAG: protein kinase [Candidatus Poseidoniales archaeon]|nr:protein kinase [Candidatus Poseidoniales archaeon]